eukprot:scaffold51411_cov16-Tisochrysis_lutea.AAC.3
MCALLLIFRNIIFPRTAGPQAFLSFFFPTADPQVAAATLARQTASVPRMGRTSKAPARSGGREEGAGRGPRVAGWQHHLCKVCKRKEKFGENSGKGGRLRGRLAAPPVQGLERKLRCSMGG